jgi:hypothetical protein
LITEPTLFPISALPRGVLVLLCTARRMEDSFFSVSSRSSFLFLFLSSARRGLKQAMSLSPGYSGEVI